MRCGVVVGALRETLETEAENGKGLKCLEGEIERE